MEKTNDFNRHVAKWVEVKAERKGKKGSEVGMVLIRTNSMADDVYAFSMKLLRRRSVPRRDALCCSRTNTACGYRSLICLIFEFRFGEKISTLTYLRSNASGALFTLRC